MTDVSALLETLRPQLLRYAKLQLRNAAWAEDAVSETMLAALEKPEAFAGRAQPKTWLIGILKHKLIDQVRKHSRECSMTTDDDDGGAAFEEALYDQSGHFRETPIEWGDPQAVIGQQQFMVVLDACVEKLPNQLGRVFLMREWMELETDEICKELSITPTNLWVMLHRARLRLRECLQINWFSTPAPSAIHTAAPPPSPFPSVRSKRR
ncbi:MAG: sigma-70 family RNA polymerase sigma factor [Methylibium sp.]|uniref:sigma-70 family RNA polymerase sigma factor n=1 Tax=Methylibium sp. TaxID=2067992 RepID=UPI0018517AF7|nr:sigma-70 family RNA polymerase sigma factor [Methylibium sp.]MBA2721645.1 sigma-70 family RNA polymerase sigma factor [Methylibium sp.]MBA3590051.1 sigma-70 family RNA polymerase sigma factor [Methylibium sp.]